LTNADFRFTPLETNLPTVNVQYMPSRPSANDVVTVNVSAFDDSGIASIKIYEWGITVDGTSTLVQLVRKCSTSTCIYSGGPI